MLRQHNGGRKSGILLLVFFFAAAEFFSAFAAEATKIKILVTNDVHGNVYEDSAAERIGYAKLRGYADALEREGWTVYLMDAGDAFSGNAVAQFDAGRSVAGLLGKAGYSVLNPGNHAFDYNQSEENELYYQNVLLPATGAAAVTANITYNGATPPGMSGEPIVVYEDNGGEGGGNSLRIVVTGVTTPYVSARGTQNFDFGLVRDASGGPDHAATKARVLGMLDAAAAPYDRPGDIVILLSHLGCDDTEDYADGQITGRDAASVPNIDFIADSHSHNTIVAERIGETYYGLAGRYLTNFAEITVTRDSDSMEIKSYDDLADIPASETILAETRRIADALGMSDRVFELGDEVDLSDARVAEASTPLGRFICRAMRDITGADFALFNAGGIRSGLAPGQVTVGDIYDMTPFQNNLQTFRLTGEEVYGLFENMPPPASNGFPQFQGITAYVSPSDDPDAPYYDVAGLLDADGELIDLDAVYTFATISYLAEGGDGYSFPADELEKDHGDFFARLANHLREQGAGDLSALAKNDALRAFPSEDAAETAFLAESFRKHCARVFVHGKTHNGEEPSTATFADDIRSERPTPQGGYWWNETHVVTHDPVLQDEFIDHIEVALPGGEGAAYPARVAARFVRAHAMLLEVLPDAEGNLPASRPMYFVNDIMDDARTLSYGWAKGKWRITLGAAPGPSALADDGEATAELAAQGILVNPDGHPVALSFGDTLSFSEDLFTAEDAAAGREQLRARLADAVLETTFRLRITVDEDDADGERLSFADDLIPDGSDELRAPGIVVGANTLLVPVALPNEGIARIDGITVTTARGERVPAKFLGAFRNYMALLVETAEPLPTDNLPPGFALLNPLLRQNFEGESAPSLPEGELIQRWRIDYELGRRRETADYDRWTGTFRGYRNDPVVETKTSEPDASLAFGTGGRLAALALTPRVLKSDSARSVTATPGFRPVDFLSRRLRDPDAFDPSLHPVDEGQGERLIDLGVEFQPLDANTARLFGAVQATRGGEIGLLATHVYPGTLADTAGLAEHDVLLRIFIEGRREPVELRSANQLFGEGEYEADMSTEAFQSLIRFLPPPWPPRDNAVSALLTGAGAGRRVRLDFLREGEPRSAEFVTAFFDPDYRSAPKKKFAALGLTAKPLTYEVARFFNKPQGRGVVVSRVEEGGKAAVAGLHHYLVVTRVDGEEVGSLDDFAARVENFESAAAPAVELTVESFGKTRLVKIENEDR